nr:hypothetical protein [Priestia aryabhattai]MDH3125967.1 hypothetical protein [Priestia aryabhattai]
MRKQKSMHIGKLIILSVFITIFLAGCDSRYLILNPQGAVAQKEYHLIIFSIFLCAIVVIPVLGLLVYIVLRYRDKPETRLRIDQTGTIASVLNLFGGASPLLLSAF